jgi:hypothetical protein
MGSGFFICGWLFMTWGIILMVNEGQYATTGALSSRIVAKTIDHVRRGSTDNTSFVISYRFTTARGQSVDGREVTQRRAWDALHEGDAISVRYLPHNPRSNREANKGGIGGAVIIAIAGLLFCGLGVRKLGFVVRPAFLKRAGGSTEGVVVAVEPSSLKIRASRGSGRSDIASAMRPARIMKEAAARWRRKRLPDGNLATSAPSSMTRTAAPTAYGR